MINKIYKFLFKKKFVKQNNIVLKQNRVGKTNFKKNFDRFTRNGCIIFEKFSEVGVGFRAFDNVNRVSGYIVTVRTIDNQLGTLI